MPSPTDCANCHDLHRREEIFLAMVRRRWAPTEFLSDAGTIHWIDGPAADDVAALGLVSGLRVNSVTTIYSSMLHQSERGGDRPPADRFSHDLCSALDLPVGWLACHRSVSKPEQERAAGPAHEPLRQGDGD